LTWVIWLPQTTHTHTASYLNFSFNFSDWQIFNLKRQIFNLKLQAPNFRSKVASPGCCLLCEDNVSMRVRVRGDDGSQMKAHNFTC